MNLGHLKRFVFLEKKERNKVNPRNEKKKKKIKKLELEKKLA